MKVKKLQGDKIYLAPVTEEALEDFVSFMYDAEMALFTSTFAQAFSLEDERAYFAPSQDKFQLAIYREETHETLGLVELMKIDPIHRSAEIGISLGRGENRSQGYGREAMRLMLDQGFGHLNLHTIYLTVLEKNKRAQGLYRSLGFKEAGLLRDHRYLAGAYENVLYMDLVKEDYPYWRLDDQRKILEQFEK
ncbi:MAG: GNAT family protein [Tissierellia bacterium]|nr:GNAT family protein [Tissierellia bacterium]